MKKIIIGVIAFAVVFGGIIYILSGRNNTGKIPTPQSATEKTGSNIPTQAPELIWDDPAGFTFRYSGGLNINNHEEDPDNYAHVELTSPTNPGNIIVWAKDTTAADVTAWVRTEKEFQGANVIDTTLGGQPAKKIILTGTVKKTVTGIVYDGLLFMIEGNTSGDTFWTSEYQKIGDSFRFKPPDTQTSDTSGGNSSGGGYDEEETVE